jgi:alpha-tubulin suppressor-like RCC1 family protein
MGKEDFGLLGINGNKILNKFEIAAETPTLVEALEGCGVKAICAGGWHSCFLTDQGRLMVCGKGEYGRLGLGCEKSRTVPTFLDLLSPCSADTPPIVSCYQKGTIASVSAGGSHTIVSTSEGEIFAVGRLDGGRCGVGAIGKSDRIVSPVNISDKFLPAGKKIVKQVSSGGSHSVVLIEYPDDNESTEYM